MLLPNEAAIKKTHLFSPVLISKYGTGKMWNSQNQQRVE